MMAIGVAVVSGGNDAGHVVGGGRVDGLADGAGAVQKGVDAAVAHGEDVTSSGQSAVYRFDHVGIGGGGGGIVADLVKIKRRAGGGPAIEVGRKRAPAQSAAGDVRAVVHDGVGDIRTPVGGAGAGGHVKPLDRRRKVRMCQVDAGIGDGDANAGSVAGDDSVSGLDVFRVDDVACGGIERMAYGFDRLGVHDAGMISDRGNRGVRNRGRIKPVSVSAGDRRNPGIRIYLDAVGRQRRHLRGRQFIRDV